MQGVLYYNKYRTKSTIVNYNIGNGVKIQLWIIFDNDRAVTTYTINEISFSYFMHDIPDGDKTLAVGPWNMSSLHNL